MLSPKTPRSRFPCQETRKVPGSLGPQMKMSWSRVAPSPLRNLGIVCSQSLTKSLLTDTGAGGRG